MVKRIGFACKFSELHPTKGVVSVPKYNGQSTTMRWLREHPSEAVDRLLEIMNYNTKAALALVEKLGTMDPSLRMVRIGSEILPGYTHADWQAWWKQKELQYYLARIFAPIGEAARRLDVRLSFHPGQFCVLASENPGIVERSIEEFEYHADMARWMGYGKTFQDFKINVHISGKQGPAGIRAALKRLSPEARNCMAIENDENSWGLDSSLELAKDCALTLDIHHHWIRTGEYIQPNDDRIKGVIDSWRGVRPTMHYSVSREDYLVDHTTSVAPDYAALLESGHKKQKLRAHSDFYWNTVNNEWALGFLNTHDIMCESKSKNLASFALHKTAVELNLI